MIHLCHIEQSENIMNEIKLPPVDSTLDTISKRLKYVVVQKGIKQAHIARKLGISRGAVHHTLNSDAKNSRGAAQKIASLLDVNLEWLYTGKIPDSQTKPTSTITTLEQRETIPVYYLDQLLMLRQNVGNEILPLSHILPQRQYDQEIFAIQLSMPSVLQKFEAGDIVVFAKKVAVRLGDWVLVYNAEEGRIIVGVVTFHEANQIVVLHHKIESPLIIKSSSDLIIGVFVESVKYARA